MKIFIIAGEASGDQLGAAVLKSLQKLTQLDIRGIGGDAIKAAGLRDSLFPMEDLSLMGVAEILPEIPHMLRRIRQTVDAIKVYNPDIVLSVDCPEFSLRVQEKLAATACRAKRIHMVAPSVWAWREGRARKMARFLDGIICLFPFEPPYFEREGMKACFIGHTMMGSGILDANGAGFRFRHMIGNDRKVVGLLFGSRKAEIERCSDLILDAACELRKENPDIYFIAPTIPRWKNLIEEKLKERFLNGMVLTDEKWDSFAACDAAIVVSGTVALEIAVVGVPHVITYKMNPVTWKIFRRFIKTPYGHLANILLKREAVPEFMQERATIEKIVPAISKLLLDTEERRLQCHDLKNVRTFLTADNKNPADAAAGFLVDSIKS